MKLKNEIGTYSHYLLKNEKARISMSLRNDVNYMLSQNQDEKFTGAVYISEFICPKTDFSYFEKIKEELKDNEILQWSRHFKIDNPTNSLTFNSLIHILSLRFNMEIYVSRLNYYPNGLSWKPFHQDSHAFDLNGEKKEDITIGISLGYSRNLSFKHIETGEIFNFPQNNGDIFAFDKIVNQKFYHGVPSTSENVGPRISIIVWGKRKEEFEINETKKIDKERKINPLKYKLKNKNIVQ